MEEEEKYEVFKLKQIKLESIWERYCLETAAVITKGRIKLGEKKEIILKKGEIKYQL